MFQPLFNETESKQVQLTLENIRQNLLDIAMNHQSKHVYARHVDKDDEFLLERIEFGKKAATSYYSEKSAKEATASALIEKWELVEAFLLCKHMEYVEIRINTEKSVGYGYLAGYDGVFEDLHDVMVVLAKSNDTPWGFYIYTTYPMITKDIVAEAI